MIRIRRRLSPVTSMKIHLVLCLLFVGILGACSRQARSLPGCWRFTELSHGRYRFEVGSLGPDGFTPYTSEVFEYSGQLHQRSELRPVLGKALFPLSLWTGLGSSRGFRRSKEVWVINGVPYVAIEHSASTAFGPSFRDSSSGRRSSTTPPASPPPSSTDSFTALTPSSATANPTA